MFMSKNNLFIYKRPRGQSTDTHQNGPSAQLLSGGRRGSVSGVREEELLEGFGERSGGVGGERIHTLHRYLVLDTLGNDVALHQRLEVDLVVGPHHSEGLLDAQMQRPAHPLCDGTAKGTQAAG
jgi:hypothetical protein